MTIADYWNRDTAGKWQAINELPAPKPKQNRRCRNCRDADARTCFVQRQPITAKVDASRACDCECHGH